jgi:glycosyltransferase involved in cell wall biosynthesis
MKIGFYIHQSTLKAGGIFTYSIGILKLLLNSKEIEKICLIYSPEIKNEILSILENPKIESLEIDRRKRNIKFSLMLSYFLHDNYLLIKNYFPDSNKFDFLRSLSFLINPYKKRINKKDISLLHIPMQYSPVYSLNIPIITTMHDLQEFHFPEFFSAQERLHRAINNKKSIEESSHIIASFNHIKSDILKYFRIDENKISVCPPPFTDSWFIKNEFADFNTVKNKYSLPDKFILYPAATWQHKNHLNLLTAVHKLKNEGFLISLVCTGNKTEYYENVLSKLITKLNLNNNVKFLGIIPEMELISLYKLTKLVVIPTLYEAGSAPLYEAMRYNAPVICSGVTSLAETIANNQFIFDPKDANSISQLILKMLSDEKLLNDNILNSQRRISELLKENYAENFCGVYEKIMHKG